MKILVLGGTRFFGKRLVHQLIKDGHQVSIFTRGQTRDDFGDSVTRLIGDRTQKESLQKAIGSSRFEVVVDQMCMSASDAAISVETFKEKIEFYIMTSTLSVYSLGADLKEESVDPFSFQPKPAITASEKYAEGKRAAEHIFATQKEFPVAFMRIPIVLGEDDYTERLLNQVQKIKNNFPVFYPNLDARISFVHAHDAARALNWMIQKRPTGVFNIASADAIPVHELIEQIESETHTKAQLLNSAEAEALSPLGIREDWYMNVEKAESAGFRAQPLSEWLRPLIRYYTQSH